MMFFEKEDLILLASEIPGYTNSKGMKLIENRFSEPHRTGWHNSGADPFELVFMFENIYYRVLYDVPAEEVVDWACKNPPQPFSIYDRFVPCEEVEPVQTVSYRKIQ